MSSKATTAGGATGLLGFILSSPGIGLLGVAVAFIGVLVGVYFQWRHDQREQREHELRLADLQEALDDKKS
jgi:predicted benzoate:H+ symporter BenE